MFWKCTLWIQVTFSFILKKHISDLTVNQDMDAESCFLQHQSILNCFTTRLMFSYTPHLMWIRIDQFYFILFHCVAKSIHETHPRLSSHRARNMSGCLESMLHPVDGLFTSAASKAFTDIVFTGPDSYSGMPTW